MGWVRSPVRFIARYAGTTKQDRHYSMDQQKNADRAGRRSHAETAAYDYETDLLNFRKFRCENWHFELTVRSIFRAADSCHIRIIFRNFLQNLE